MKQLKISKKITTIEGESMARYFKDIYNIPLLTQEQEKTIGKKARHGDKQSIEKLVLHNLRFVISVAKQYQNQGMSVEDLINEGNIGLIKAAEKFDEERGIKFISYAVWWIRQSILQSISDNSRTIRLPYNKIKILNRVNKIVESIQQREMREVDDMEILEEIGDDGLRLTDLYLHEKKTSSMDTPLPFASEKSDKGLTLHDVIRCEDDDTPGFSSEKESLGQDISRVLDTLGIKHKKIVCMYFGLLGEDCKTLEEIAEKFELTRERVRQIKESSIKKLRNYENSKLLREYFSG